ncbi:MAG: MBOAT family O-acyltransferase [bacterium]
MSITKRFWPQAEAGVGKGLLLGTALTLLASESWLTIGAFSWVVTLGWLCLLMQSGLKASKIRTAFCVIILVLQLLPLLYFKYWDFFFNDIMGLGVRMPSVIIPMGLSFYSFQIIGFWVDNLRVPQPKPKLIDYLNFAAFFPQIVAGPIEKREELLPQMQKFRFRLHLDKLDQALSWTILGLGYKMIIADNIALCMENFYVDPNIPWQVWFECLAFGLRIYFDFAGYSFIAVGVGLFFGVQLTLNFRSPYWATGLREFWHNWHVSLGTWLKDYVYVPLGGKRVKLWALNILMVFLVSGIWHGAGWGFLIWGLLHGIGMIACNLLPQINGLTWLKRLATFTFCTAAWLFFYEQDSEIMFNKALSLVNITDYSFPTAESIRLLLGENSNILTTGLITGLGMLALGMEGWSLRKKAEPYTHLRHPAIIVATAALIVLLSPIEESSFIYFNF